ncbi:hypothetical protein [Spirosoma pollinicola]|nr:hypothetical protein [Spirosoma pollinicola]
MEKNTMSGADLSQQLQEHGQQLARKDRLSAVIFDKQQPGTKGQRGGEEQ